MAETRGEFGATMGPPFCFLWELDPSVTKGEMTTGFDLCGTRDLPKAGPGGSRAGPLLHRAHSRIYLDDPYHTSCKQKVATFIGRARRT